MKVLVAAEDSGCLKQIEFRSGTDTSKQKDAVVSTVSFGAALKNPVAKLALAKLTLKASSRAVPTSYIVALRRDKSLQVYPADLDPSQPPSAIKTWTWTDSGLSNDGRPIALEQVNDCVYICTDLGSIALVNLKTLDCKGFQLDLKPGAHLRAFTHHRHHKDPLVFCVGGERHDLQIIKLVPDQSSVVSLWAAKNLKNDNLDLAVPVDICCIVALDSSTVATSTKQGHVRVYEPLKARRPAHDFAVAKYPINCMIQAESPRVLICADTHMTTCRLHIDRPVDHGKYVGASGAIQDLHILGSCLATGGLDRYLRLFDVASRDPVAKVFVGTQISALVMLDENDGQPVETDELWTDMASVDDQKVKRVRVN